MLQLQQFSLQKCVFDSDAGNHWRPDDAGSKEGSDDAETKLASTLETVQGTFRASCSQRFTSANCLQMLLYYHLTNTKVTDNVECDCFSDSAPILKSLHWLPTR